MRRGLVVRATSRMCRMRHNHLASRCPPPQYRAREHICNSSTLWVSVIMTQYAIQTRNLRKHFGDVKAVDGVDLEIERGQIFALLGPNGAGKSTMIYALVGVLRADAGDIRILGSQIPDEKLKVLKRVGFMPQEIALYDDLTPRDNLMFFGRLFGMDTKDVQRRTDELFALLRLEEKADVPVHQLSGGQKRRTSLAVALVHDPEIMILEVPSFFLPLFLFLSVFIPFPSSLLLQSL